MEEYKEELISDEEVLVEQAASVADAMQSYLRKIIKRSGLDQAHELDLVRRIREGDAQSKNKLIEKHLRIVVSIARCYQNRGIELMDLIQEGNFGLLHAIDKFDPTFGTRFSTYASYWIRERIEMALLKHNDAIEVPVSVRKEVNACHRYISLWKAKHGRTPPAVELERHFKKTKKDMQHMLSLTQQVTYSLDAPFISESTLSFVDILPDEQILPHDMKVYNQELTGHIHEALSELPQRWRAVLECRFGLNGQREMTLQQIADLMDISVGRVQQLQVRAIKQLRQSVNLKSVYQNCD